MPTTRYMIAKAEVFIYVFASFDIAPLGGANRLYCGFRPQKHLQHVSIIE